jgi:hypothetical protein
VGGLVSCAHWVRDIHCNSGEGLRREPPLQRRKGYRQLEKQYTFAST